LSLAGRDETRRSTLSCLRTGHADQISGSGPFGTSCFPPGQGNAIEAPPRQPLNAAR
jgi:hypothetical protein